MSLHSIKATKSIFLFNASFSRNAPRSPLKPSIKCICRAQMSISAAAEAAPRGIPVMSEGGRSQTNSVLGESFIHSLFSLYSRLTALITANTHIHLIHSLRYVFIQSICLQLSSSVAVLAPVFIPSPRTALSPLSPSVAPTVSSMSP